MNRFAVLTSGGDSPGMNAAVRAVVRAGLGRSATVFGVQHGYDGLLDGEIVELVSADVGGIIGRGGTILRSARSKRFLQPDARIQGAEGLRGRGIEGLIVIGGDGSQRGAKALHDECGPAHVPPLLPLEGGGQGGGEFAGLSVMGIPATIDNDVACTDASIGFDTAVNTALDAADKIRDTAYSHERVFVIEVMGRHNGFIAVEAGLAAGAEAILIPELPFSLPEVCDRLMAGHRRGKKSSIIVVAEGAARASDVAAFITEQTGHEVRYVVLGHMQRGGAPTAFDRVLATRFGSAAVHRLLAGTSGHMVGVDGNRIVSTPLETVFSTERKIDPERLLLAEVMAQ